MSRGFDPGYEKKADSCVCCVVVSQSNGADDDDDRASPLDLREVFARDTDDETVCFVSY